MHRRALIAIIMLLTTWGTAYAGDKHPAPGQDQTLRLLRSSDSRDIAWGAWLAGEHKPDGAAAMVVQCLEASTKPKGPKVHWLARANLVDAAIRLRARPSHAALVALSGSHTAAATVLAIRDARTAHQSLLAMFDRYDGRSPWNARAWLALGNHMQARKTPGFGMRALAGLKFTRRVHVWDRYGPYPEYRGPSGAIPGDGTIRVPKGYPPIAMYGLTLTAGTRTSVLAGGTRPVHTYRNVWTKKGIGFGTVGQPNRVDCRLEWITGWLDEPRVPVRPRVVAPPRTGVIDVRLTGRQPWVREVTAIQKALYEHYWSVVRELMRRGLLREIEAVRLLPSFEFQVVDERKLKRKPLPAFPELKPRNPWRERRRKRR